jgi:hypothetical protein
MDIAAAQQYFSGINRDNLTLGEKPGKGTNGSIIIGIFENRHYKGMKKIEDKTFRIKGIENGRLTYLVIQIDFGRFYFDFVP